MTAPAPGAPPCAVTRCSNPTHNQQIVCWGCLDALRRDLRDLNDLLPELEVTLTRQDRAGDQGGIPEPVDDEPHTQDSAPGAVTVLPFRPHASDIGRLLHALLDHWTHHLLEALNLTEAEALGWVTRMPGQRTTGDLAPNRWVARPPSARTLELAAWLERHPDSIATNPDAGPLVEGLRWAVEDVRRVIWPRQLVYCGPCNCPSGQLYAPAGATSVSCRDCGNRWAVDECVRYFRQQAEGVRLSAEDMSRALPRLAADIAIPPLTASQIRGFGHRGRLLEHRPDPRTWTVDEHGTPVPPPPRYKVGEVIALMHTLLEEEQARQERRARAASATTRTRVVAAYLRLREAIRV
jgi:hypothetical protein